MRHFLLSLAFILAACSDDQSQNASELTNVADDPANAIATEVEGDQVQANDQVPASAPKMLAVGPLQVRYDDALLAPVRAGIPIPPDWARQAQGWKLLARDRAALIGEAECMYGQSGQASQCNAVQEAGLAFAMLDTPYPEISGKLPADQRKPFSLAGAKGLSWQIGTEGEGAEYILLPAGAGTLLIVRQFRNAGNPDEAAIGRVLNDLKLGNAE